MKRVLLTGMLIAMGITGSMLFAAEPATTPATSGPAATTKDAKATPTSSQSTKTDAAKAAPVNADASKPDAKADASAAAKAPESASKDEEKAPPPTAADKGPSPQRFTPSEQVRADFDVSFPVDI